jgi:hypothetical protein
MLQADAKMGRLNIITTMGDANNDGKYEEPFAFGGRSLVFNGDTGSLVMTVKNELDKKAHEFGTYDDGRSDAQRL